MTRTSTPARPTRVSVAIPNPPSGTKGATTALPAPTTTPFQEVTSRKAGSGARGKNPSTAAANGKKPATKKPPPPPLSKVATRQHPPNVPFDETPPPVPDSLLRVHQSPERSTSPTLDDTVAAANGPKKDPVNNGTSRGNGCQCDRGEKRAISLGHGEPCCRSAPHAGLLNRLCMLNLAVCRAIVHHTKSSVGWPSKSGTQDCVWSALEFFVNNPARLSDGLCEYMSFWCHCDFLHLCILDVTWLQYRQRVLDAPDLRPIFFFSRGVALSKPAGPNVIPQDKVRAAASVFEADWPMKKMIRDALKNEK